MALEFLFWTLLFLIFYVYVGYPAVIFCLSRFIGKPVLLGDNLFDVSIIIAAYNEESSIAQKIEQSIDQQYPADRLEVIVNSDGSTDRTDQIVESYSSRGVILRRYEGRKGKTYCQNETVKTAKGEIIVFTDATSEYERETIRRIVEPFSDESVGCVCAELSYVAHYRGAKEVGKSEGMYWKIEKKLKAIESRLSSCLGASGALYAMRKSAYTPLAAELISDFVEPLGGLKKGLRTVYHSPAKCYDQTAKSFRTEFHRKVRTILRALNSLPAVKSLFNPFKHGIVAFQLFSHKLLRWLMPVLMLALFGVNLFLFPGNLYAVLFVVQMAFYLLALIGIAVKAKPFSIAHYFCLVNAASLIAIAQCLMGKNRVVWDTER